MSFPTFVTMMALEDSEETLWTLQHHLTCKVKLFVCGMGCIPEDLMEMGIPPRGSVRFQSCTLCALPEPPILPSLFVCITVKGSGVTLGLMTPGVCDTAHNARESASGWEDC